MLASTESSLTKSYQTGPVRLTPGLRDGINTQIEHRRGRRMPSSGRKDSTKVQFTSFTDCCIFASFPSRRDISIVSSHECTPSPDPDQFVSYPCPSATGTSSSPANTSTDPGHPVLPNWATSHTSSDEPGREPEFTRLMRLRMGLASGIREMGHSQSVRVEFDRWLTL